MPVSDVVSLLVIGMPGLAQARELTGLGSMDVPTAMRHFTGYGDKDGNLTKAAFFRAFSDLVSCVPKRVCLLPEGLYPGACV